MTASDEKEEIRKVVRAKRRAQLNKDELSQQIVSRLMDLADYAIAETVMFYVDVRDEVRTRAALPTVLRAEKRIVVPYCAAEDLQAYHLVDMNELCIGRYGIPEPKPELRTLPSKRVDVSEIQLVVVPGVAFDKYGGRLGHGKGYYDRLLNRVSPQSKGVALAFECQLVAKLPMSQHDVSMHKIVTEYAVYDCRS